VSDLCLGSAVVPDLGSVWVHVLVLVSGLGPWALVPGQVSLYLILGPNSPAWVLGLGPKFRFLGWVLLWIEVWVSVSAISFGSEFSLGLLSVDALFLVLDPASTYD
uniref:Uncharacterized protein n=1 Tax=Cannabis sativa TaxID=3483 RepID=A0A803PKS9_CANSA